MNSMISIPDEVFQVISAQLEEATVELFAAYEFVVRAGGTQPVQPDDARSGAAIIGFVGEKLRGALILCASNSAIAHRMPAIGAAPGEESDTLGEFSNMLLGRLKGRLLSEGLVILVLTPTTTSGASLQLSAPTAQSTTEVFEAEGWTVTTRLDASFDPGFELNPACTADAAAAGDAMLF